MYEAILWRKNRWEKLVQSFYRIIPYSIFPSALSGLVCKDANDVIFIASLREDYSSLITLTVRKFYWCSNCFSLPDFTPLLLVVNSRRQFGIAPLLPGCSEPSNTQVFFLIFHRSLSKWWTFGPWRSSKFERSPVSTCMSVHFHTYVQTHEMLTPDNAPTVPTDRWSILLQIGFFSS